MKKGIFPTDGKMNLPLEASQINFKIPTDVAKYNYTLVIMTGEEELHYYTANIRVN